MAKHAPFDVAAFEGAQLLTHRPLTEDDLEGFYAYLKATDFRRYVSVTQQDPKAIIATANQHYDQGRACGEARQYREAIAHYQILVQLLPQDEKARAELAQLRALPPP